MTLITDETACAVDTQYAGPASADEPIPLAQQHALHPATEFERHRAFFEN